MPVTTSTDVKTAIQSSLTDQMWLIMTCIIWSAAVIVSSILQMYYLTEYIGGFFANEVIFYVQIYTHYLVSFRYFLNEYYMCAILHYMSYDCV